MNVQSILERILGDYYTLEYYSNKYPTKNKIFTAILIAPNFSEPVVIDINRQHLEIVETSVNN